MLVKKWEKEEEEEKGEEDEEKGEEEEEEVEEWEAEDAAIRRGKTKEKEE